jgi:hypothetical protein
LAKHSSSNYCPTATAVYPRPAPNYVFPPGATIPPYAGVHVFVSDF